MKEENQTISPDTVPQPVAVEHSDMKHPNVHRFSERVNHVFQSMTPVEKIFFVQNLEVLIRAGFSLSHALTTVAKQSKRKRVQEVVRDLSNQVETGKTFAEALRNYEKIFDPLFINMVESGEVSGKLETTLKELSTQLKKSHQLFLKIRNALAYPLVILVAMLGIGTGMMVFVIPKITDLYKGKEDVLPWPTKVVIFLSDFIVHNGLLSLVLLIVLLLVLMMLYRIPRVQLFTHRMVLHAPIFGNVVREYNIARFSRVFHTLISTDMPIIRSFEIISNTLGNQSFRAHVRAAVPRLEKGESISTVLSEDDLLFPSTVIEILNVGEESGSLDEMSGELAEYYEGEVSSVLDGLSVLIEPLLMLVLGMGVGLIAVAVLWPMYNLVNVI